MEHWEEQYGDYYIRITPTWKMEKDLAAIDRLGSIPENIRKQLRNHKFYTSLLLMLLQLLR